MDTFTLITPAEGEVLTQHTPEQRDFQTLRERLKTQEERIDWLHLKKSEQADHSIPQMLFFAWKNEADCIAQGIEVAENPQFTGHVMHFAALPGRQEAQAHSLKTNTQYYWRVVGVDATGTPLCSQTASFRTADEAPRWIFFEGTPNVRDLGGWHTLDGRRVRQGLVYRGGELNSHQTATPAGLRFAEYELGIRTDLDIRGQVELDMLPSGGPAFSPHVRWLNIPLAAYADINTAEQRANYAKAFRAFSDPTNFPIYMHCWGGADRTGTLVFLINAVLGVPDEWLLLDYEMTALATWGARSRDNELFQGFMAMLRSYSPAPDYQAQAIAYWNACGITDAEIANLKGLFLE